MSSAANMVDWNKPIQWSDGKSSRVIRSINGVNAECMVAIDPKNRPDNLPISIRSWTKHEICVTRNGFITGCGENLGLARIINVPGEPPKPPKTYETPEGWETLAGAFG